MVRLKKVWVLGIALSVLLTGPMAFAGGKGNGGQGKAMKGSASGTKAQDKWNDGMLPGADQGQKKGWTDSGPRGWDRGHKNGWENEKSYPKGIGKK